MNCLFNKETIKALETQMSYETMIAEQVYQRVYSEFDGRLYAILDKESKKVNYIAYSWHSSQCFDNVVDAAKWLTKVYIIRAKYLRERNKKCLDFKDPSVFYTQ